MEEKILQAVHDHVITMISVELEQEVKKLLPGIATRVALDVIKRVNLHSINNEIRMSFSVDLKND